MNADASPLVLSGWARTVVHALDKLGADTDAVMREAGVTRETLEGDSELPIAVTTKLWQEAARATEDPAFGLKAARYVRLPALHGLAYAVQASGTLREAVARFERYSRVVSDAATIRTQETDESLRLYFEIRQAEGAPSCEAMDATLSMIVRGLRALTEGKIDLVAVSLRRPEPEDPTPFHKFFGVNVSFGAPADMLALPSSELDRPLPNANAELARHNEKAVATYLQRLDQVTVTDRARLAILQELPSGGVSVARVAKLTATSPRSLQRQLSAEGTTFAAILDDVRRELAREYLREGDRTTTEIAFLLGFADSSAFSRAFKRWTGESPAAFRARCTDGEAR